MIETGKYNQLRVGKFVDFGLYLTDGVNNVLLPRKYVPPGIKIGDTMNVFVYPDSEDRPVATTATPAGCVGDIVALRVVALSNFGAFLDWHLEKDLFVPFKEMQNKKMTPGKLYTVEIRYDDKSGRLIGSNRFDRIYRQHSVRDLTVGQRAAIIVIDETDIGWRVMVNRKYSGMLYKSETFQPLHPGDHLTAFIGNIRDDGKLDMRLRQGGREEVLSECDTVLQKLRENDNFLPFTTKSSPESVENEFSMSKKMFKQILSHLYREHLIALEENGIRLLPAPKK